MGPHPAERDCRMVSGAKTCSNSLAERMSRELPRARSGSKGMALAEEASTVIHCAAADGASPSNMQQAEHIRERRLMGTSGLLFRFNSGKTRIARDYLTLDCLRRQGE